MNQPLEKIIGGKYEILGKIREGGMGAIYKVRHRLLDEVRVIKVLRPQFAGDPALKVRFHNEAKTAIKLRHPNIAHLYDFSIDEAGNAYIVMEFIAGVNFKELVEKSGALELALALELGRQSLDAIGYLHQKGFIHRDIAADNLMLTQDFQGQPLVKLIDLGIAKGENRSGQLTATGIFLGKARYAPPEQFTPEGASSLLDERGDLYSFGVLFYELLTGRSPIEGESFSEMVAGHLFRPPIPFDESDPDGTVPQELRAAVMKVLEKQPEDRYGSAEELAEILAGFQRPEDDREKSFARAMKTTIAMIAVQPEETKPGSTQGRIDEQFALDQTSGLVPGPPEAPEPVPAPVGRAAAPGAAVAGSGPKRKALWIGGAAIVVAAAALTLIFTLRPLARGPQTVEPTDPSGPAMEIAAPEPFDPDRYTPTDSELDLEEALPPFEAKPDRDSQATPRQPRGGPPESPTPKPRGDSEFVPDIRPGPEARQGAPSGPPPRPGETFQPGPGVRPPELVSIPPAVPPAGSNLKADVVIVVSALVDETGRVLTARIRSGPAFKRKLKEAAVELAKQAEFRPALRNGHPGRMWADVRLVYKSE